MRRRSRPAGSESAHPAARPVRCILYLRLSDARNENDSFPDREAALRARAAQLGWLVVRVIIENDVQPGLRRSASAFKRRRIVKPDGSHEYRVWRPGFRSALDDLAASPPRAEALLAEDLDRVVRDPRDLEDLIDVCERHGCWANSLSGSLTFTRGGTDTEITTARLMVTVANKASRDTARRVSGGRARTASAGKFGGGTRPFGYGLPKVDPAGHAVIDPRTGEQQLDYDAVVADEAEALVLAADMLLAGVPLRGCAQALNTRGVKPVKAAKWTPTTLRDVLLRPRNAGLSVSHGEVVGVGNWPAILDEDVWRAIVDKLNHPDRRTSPGPAPKWFGSGIFRCGRCGGPLYVDRRTRPSESKGQKPSALARSTMPSYFCRSGHLRRRQPLVDALVEAVVMERLARPDAADLLAIPDQGVDLGALRARAAVLRQSRSDLTAVYDDGLIPLADLRRRLQRIKDELTEIEAAQLTGAGDGLLKQLIGTDDVSAAWESLSLAAKREVLPRVVRVTIKPLPPRTGGGNAPFNRDAILIEDPDS